MTEDWADEKALSLVGDHDRNHFGSTICPMCEMKETIAAALREAEANSAAAVRIEKLERALWLIANSDHFHEGDYGHQFVIIARTALEPKP